MTTPGQILYHPMPNDCIVTEITRSSANSGAFKWDGTQVVTEGTITTIFSGQALGYFRSKQRRTFSAGQGPAEFTVAYVTVSQDVGAVEPGDEVTLTYGGNTTTYTVKSVDSQDFLYLYKIHFREV